MPSGLKEVDYTTYCQLCEHYLLSEGEFPCKICLCRSMRENSRKPEYFKEKEPSQKGE